MADAEKMTTNIPVIGLRDDSHPVSDSGGRTIKENGNCQCWDELQVGKTKLLEMLTFGGRHS